ncbi:polysaccharide lyase family 4 protein [Xylariales sp. PMI_506]|nr:polysaccharide lyase family 4 protein [Xylariales sp. PMI_506]
MRSVSLPEIILLLGALWVPSALTALTATQNSTFATIANDRLVASVNKGTGAVTSLHLDGQDLLGPTSGSYGSGPYLDCNCVPTDVIGAPALWVPGATNATYDVVSGTDSSGVAYGGIILTDTWPATGQILQQYWFLRDTETGLHTFSRLRYVNESAEFLAEFISFRTLFRPSSPIWTHLITDENIYAPLPYPNPSSSASNALEYATTVQDTTWLINNPEDPYVEAFADLFTKYTFSAVFQDHTTHGIYSDGAQTEGNNTFGAWMVMNTKDTYWGGPTHSDLVVDGIVYNYMVSNHHGDNTPNITSGFDRTFGPSFFYFNKGEPGTSWQDLRNEAVAFANPSWNAQFYDDISVHVPGYVPTSGRGTWKAKIQLPHGAENPLAILAQNGVDYQDNVLSTSDYQYWAHIDSATGEVEIDRVLAGTYRLTVYADGIFGQYTQDDVVVVAGKTSDCGNVVWHAESAGTELWRIGTPDRSAGEWKHGYTPDPNHPLHPPEYRIYWASYDFIDEFPNGVNFHIGTDDIAEDFNYIHWSVFGGYANYFRPVQVEGDGNINNWTLTFELEDSQLRHTTDATFTIQLAGAKTAAGNTDTWNSSQPYNDVPYNVEVNGNPLSTWIIPFNQSSSCGSRSGVICYQLANKWTFPSSYLKGGNATNEIILSLPYNATDYESAIMPRSIYVQYDALRLEVQ